MAESDCYLTAGSADLSAADPLFGALRGRRVDPRLISSMKQTAEMLPPDPKRDAGLDALSRGDALCVLTGQQVGLAGGALMNLAKAASAVALAGKLERQSGRRVVPVFWLQTEDHDLKELLDFKIPSADEAADLFSAADLEQAARSKVPVEQVDSEPWLEIARRRLAELLAGQPDGPAALQLFNRCYPAGGGLAAGFSALLAAVLPASGLLFFNPRRADPSLLAPLFQRAYGQAERIDQEIEAAGAVEQVRLIKGSPLFFLHDRGGSRRRLQRLSSGSWELAGSGEVLPAADLEQLLVTDPGRFSTTALLRPLLQDSLFPTAAYIGGDAELAYLRQISRLYPLFELPEPLRVRRYSIAIGERKYQQWLGAAGISDGDLDLEPGRLAELIARSAAVAGLPPEELRLQVLAQLEPAMALLRKEAGAADSTLLRPAEKLEQKFAENLGVFLAKYSTALVARDSVLHERIERMRRNYFPLGLRQERVIGLVYFLAHFGVGSAEAILSQIEAAALRGERKAPLSIFL